MNEQEAASVQSEERPSVSVVIASRRPPERVRACLEALAAQDYPRTAFEVVVVDDGSPVPLASVDSGLGETLRTRVHTQAHAGPAAARNAGARIATGRFLAFTDDDCRPASDWLSRLIDALVRQPDALVGGVVLNALAHDRYAEATQALIEFLYEAYGDDPSRRFLTSNNLAVSREAFLAAGGFDESFPVPGGEDRELCERWSARGHQLVHVPGAVVWHAHAMTLRSFLRQHRNYGRGAYHVRRLRPVDSRARMSPEPVRFYLRLVADPLGRLPRRPAVVQSALLALTQVATAAGYYAESRRSRRS
jgi:GT2 family glycosyltransferase